MSVLFLTILRQIFELLLNYNSVYVKLQTIDIILEFLKDKLSIIRA